LSERGYVLPDFLKRRELIKAQVVEVAASLGGHALIGDELLDEVTALVEWPVPWPADLKSGSCSSRARC